MTEMLTASFFGVFATFVVLVVAAWVVVFGGMGALLARARNGSVPLGFCLGLLPFGWWLIWVQTEVGPGRMREVREADERGWGQS